MPKPKKRNSKKENENLFFSGFIMGAVFGLMFSFVGLGYSRNLLAIMVSRIIILLSFIVALPITVYHTLTTANHCSTLLSRA
jgi:hypothetical protein